MGAWNTHKMRKQSKIDTAKAEEEARKLQAKHNEEAQMGEDHFPWEERISQLETELAKTTASAAKAIGRAPDHFGGGGAGSGMAKRKLTDRMYCYDLSFHVYTHVFQISERSGVVFRLLTGG